MTVYTREQWAADGTLKMAEGQEIEESIYYQLLDCMPPLSLKDKKGCEAGFRVGEPYTHDLSTGRALYLAFGRRNGKYYYLGLQ